MPVLNRLEPSEVVLTATTAVAAPGVRLWVSRRLKTRSSDTASRHGFEKRFGFTVLRHCVETGSCDTVLRHGLETQRERERERERARERARERVRKTDRQAEKQIDRERE